MAAMIMINDNDKVRCELKTSLLSPFLEPTEVSSIDARLESLVTRVIREV